MKTIVILGANGRLGNETLQAFARTKNKVIAITRTGKVRHLPQDVECRAADIINRDQLIKATQGADIIVNMAHPIYTKWTELMVPMSENVLAAAKAHNATHLFPGNVYSYGTNIPDLCTDSTPFMPNTKKGHIRHKTENLFANETSVKTVIIRAGDFYGGTGTGSWFDLVIVKKQLSGVFTYPATMDITHSWAYLPDLANTFVKIVDHLDRLPNYSQWLFEGHNFTGQEMQNHIEKITGQTLKTTKLPWRFLKFLGIVAPMMREVCEMSYLWNSPHRLDGRKLTTLLGDVPTTPPEKSLQTAIHELQT